MEGLVHSVPLRILTRFPMKIKDIGKRLESYQPPGPWRHGESAFI